MLKMTNFVFTSYLLTHSYNPHEIHRELNLGIDNPSHAKKIGCRFREHAQNDQFRFYLISLESLIESS